MIKGRVSVIIPSRKERWLDQTVQDVLKHSAGEVEILAVLQDYWPDPPLKEDKRLIQLHRTSDLGMRQNINAAARIATGEYLCKLDGHCAVAEGWDEVLKADMDDNMVVVPRRLALDVETWTVKAEKPPVDYHYLSWPFEREGDVTCGLHGNQWRERAKARANIDFDSEMSSQGSMYMLTRSMWDRLIGPLDAENYTSFVQEMQEVGLKCWLGGGQMMVNKKTSYQHLFKGRQYGTGYSWDNETWKAWAENNAKGRDFTLRYWMLDQWKERKHDLRWLIEKFAAESGPIPTWPLDLDEAFRYARERLGASPAV